jgi:hypothetical protein
MWSTIAAVLLSLALLGQAVIAAPLKTVRVGSVGATAVNWPVFVAQE